MSLRDFLNASSSDEPDPGTIGNETDWFKVGTLPIPTGHLWMGDPQMSWAEASSEDGCVVIVPSGIYRVEAKGIDFNGSRFVSRIRVLLDGVGEVTLGDECGEAGTDSGQIGVADQQALKSAFEARFGDDVDAALECLEDAFHSEVGVFVPEPGSETSLVYVPSGFGDGGGPVFQLLSGEKCVGIEHAFIDASDPF